MGSFLTPYTCLYTIYGQNKDTKTQLLTTILPSPLFAGMRTPTTADALRVARALLGISIRELAPRVGIMRKAIAAAESGTSKVLEHNVQLIQFYEAQGIEFVGDLSFGKDVGRSGARWKTPNDLLSGVVNQAGFHTEKFGISFPAARSLLDLKQSDIAERASLPPSTVSALESGTQWPSSSATLRDFYIDQGVEFLGWGDAGSGLFYGVGVRWSRTPAQGAS